MRVSLQLILSQLKGVQVSVVLVLILILKVWLMLMVYQVFQEGSGSDYFWLHLAVRATAVATCLAFAVLPCRPSAAAALILLMFFITIINQFCKKNKIKDWNENVVCNTPCDLGCVQRIF